jgi:hypothetical protein
LAPSAKTAGGGPRVRRWTRELIIEKIRQWEARYGEPPCSADWNPSLARWRAQEWRAERYREGDWPSTNAAKRHFGGSFDAAVRAAGLEPHRPGPRRRAGAARPAIEPRGRGTVEDALEALLADAEARARRAEGEAGDEGEARGRAADDQAEAAARDAAEARYRAEAAERRLRELTTEADGVDQEGGSLTRSELARLRGGGAHGPAVLARALRRLARARAGGDRAGLAAALGDVASAAVRWRDRL